MALTTANEMILNNHMRLGSVTIGQNLKWPRGRLSLVRKKTSKGNYDSRFSSSNYASQRI